MTDAAFYGLWSFVPADDIYAPSIAVDVLAPALYAGFIGRTVGWTRFGLARGNIANFAIDRGRFRATFGHPLPVGSRHDFLGHHGPIVGVERGRVIAAHEHMTSGIGHPISHGMGVHSSVASHFGPGIHHTSTYGHTSFAHSSFAHSSVGASSHSFGGTHASMSSGIGAHSGFGGTTEHSSFAGSHGSFGGSGTGGFGGAQHSGFGGGSSFGGGATAQHSFGGGSYQRPAMGGGSSQGAMGGYAHATQTAAPRTAPAASSTHHH
jgi:hypothetical protein